jgi:hypothetical protein
MCFQVYRKRSAATLCTSDKQEIRAGPAIDQLKTRIIHDTKAISSPPSSAPNMLLIAPQVGNESSRENGFLALVISVCGLPRRIAGAISSYEK